MLAAPAHTTVTTVSGASTVSSDDAASQGKKKRRKNSPDPQTRQRQHPAVERRHLQSGSQETACKLNPESAARGVSGVERIVVPPQCIGPEKLRRQTGIRRLGQADAGEATKKNINRIGPVLHRKKQQEPGLQAGPQDIVQRQRGTAFFRVGKRARQHITILVADGEQSVLRTRLLCKQ